MRTVLVHVAGDERDEARLVAAAQLARRTGAALSALFIEVAPGMPVAVLGRGASAAYLGAASEAADRAASASRSRLGGLDIVWDREQGDVREILARRGRTTDLLVIGRELAGVVREMGGPVLVVPETPTASLAARILVAWDGSAQASRAVREAMPLMREAERVGVVSIGAQDATGELLNALLPWLERHGIDAIPHREEDRDEGAAILRVAHESGCDLLVMGAYGRKSLGEALFGGTTRFVLERASAPLFIAH
jgi:nucleotide-binding universal stress UspA family protein